MNKAVFLDRDGTLIEDVGYLSKVEEIKIFPEAFEALKIFKKNGFKVIMVTNQSGIARGFFTEAKFKLINDQIIKRFEEKGVAFSAVYYCPHHPDVGNEIYRKKCVCRKPAAGMLILAAKEHMIDLKLSFVVGDKNRDIEAGKKAGCKTVFVLTGHGKEHKDNFSNAADYLAGNLFKAVQWIVKNS